jgi:uncharacterized protein HemX
MKKHYIVLGVLVAVALGLAGYATYKYNQSPKPVSLQQVQHQRDAALADNAVLRQLSKNDDTAIANLKSDNGTLTTQKATLCAQIVKAKLVQPLCQ